MRFFSFAEAPARDGENFSLSHTDREIAVSLTEAPARDGEIFSLPHT
ncbi:MAG: hypothetical protein QNJ74_01970 [Trichodesmium sp. MO_231.B1]|nr:hypothetical protein [Trichodesmium sp. MO_231.B1]